MSEQLDGWYWVEWRGTLEPELFRDGRIQDHDGDWIMPAPTRKIGPRIPEPKELKATELELAKLRNLVDDLEKTLAETREERDRLRAEVERLKPKSNGEWRFFAPAFELPGCWAVRGEKGFAFLAFSKTVGEAEWCVADRQEITAAEAYARLADWPEGQRKFLELTGYVPPTCKESLPVQPEERVRCYRSSGTPSALWVYTHNERVFFYPREDDCLTHGVWDELLPDVPRKPIPLAEALEIVRDRPKQLAKLREMAGIVDACYFCGDPATKQGPFPRCDYCEASRQRSIGEGATDSIMYIAEADANRKRLALLMAIPCKEMRM